MPFKQLFVTFTCLLFLSSAHAQDGAQLLVTGKWFAEYVSAESGEVWLGLYQVGDEYELRSTTLTVTEFTTSARRMEPRKEVQTNQPSTPRFLVRGVEQLQPGKVEAIIQDWEFLYPGQRAYFQSGGIYYVLGAAGEVIFYDSSEIGIIKYKLALTSNHLKIWQTLLDVDIGLEEASPRVIWAGDLDRDEKVDLFMDTSRKYSYVEYALFLSSAAKDEEIVGQVATWRAYID